MKRIYKLAALLLTLILTGFALLGLKGAEAHEVQVGI